jgi:hypothetical protein
VYTKYAADTILKYRLVITDTLTELYVQSIVDVATTYTLKATQQQWATARESRLILVF